MEAIEMKTPLKLPEEIIQHIQSFLNGKEAARTSMLSESWYMAWLTRPNLDFSDLRGLDDVKFAEKSIQRYEELKRKIQSFRLVMDMCELSNISVAMELTVKAIKLGATDLHIECMDEFLLTPEVLQSQNLVRLSLVNAIIEIDHKVSCSRLKYINLSFVGIDVTFWDIISMCPLIEELIVHQCILGEDKKMLETKALKLKVLSLQDAEIGEWFFRVLSSSRFPCLKDLTLTLDYIFPQEIQICSNSLEYINLIDAEIMRDFDVPKLPFWAKFDVPRIRKFKFSSSRVPSLSFKKIPIESHISIMSSHYNKRNTSWLLNLSECLHQLSPSKIFLSLNMVCSSSDNGIRDIIALPEPPIQVENLTVEIYTPRSLHRELLDDLFRCCRPSFINFYWFRSPERGLSKVNTDFREFLNKVQIIKSLEEVNVEFFEKCIEGHTTLPFKTLSDALAYSSSIMVKVWLKL